MKISELKSDFYIITWDNPYDTSSKVMIGALNRLGRVEDVHAKTTIKLWPNSTTTFGRIRFVVRKNLNPLKGRAVVVGIKSKHVSHIDNAVRRGKWRTA